MRKAELAVYGGIGIHRLYCKRCKGMAFVIDGKMACCNRKVERPEEARVHVESAMPASKIRMHMRGFGQKAKKTQLTEQDHCCAYCGGMFGGQYRNSHGKLVRRRVQWDHFVPWAATYSHQTKFYAACQRCNAIKGSLVFDNLSEAISYIRGRMGEKDRKGRG